MGRYDTRPEWLAVSSFRTKCRKSLGVRTLWRLYSCETLLERLPQHFEHMAAELGQFIQEEDAVVGQRHFARQRHLAAPDQPHLGDGERGGATRAGW
jgi:hypothetical protein